MLLDHMRIIKPIATIISTSSYPIPDVSQCKRPPSYERATRAEFSVLLDRNECSPFPASLLSAFLPTRTYQQQGGHVFIP